VQRLEQRAGLRPAAIRQKRPQRGIELRRRRGAAREPRLQRSLQRRRATLAEQLEQTLLIAARTRELGPPRIGVDVGSKPEANRRAGIGFDDHVHLGVAGGVRLNREELRHVEQLRQQRQPAAVAMHELIAEQRIGVHRQQRRQGDRGAVGEHQHARMLSRLVVAVVGRQLERLAEGAALIAWSSGHALEHAQPGPAPRALHEIVAPRFQQAGRELCCQSAVALEQTICEGAGRLHKPRPYVRMPQYATAIYVKT
jgi:hypothetical protein